MNIIFGTPVLNRDGTKIGKVKEVIVDPRNRAVTHLVIQEGLLFDNDRLVSAALVLEASPTAVKLGATAAELDAMTAGYREEDFVPASAGAPATGEGALAGRYWIRPVGASPSLIPPGLGRVELPDDVSIPGDDVMMVHGCPVHTADDRLVGRVLEVRTGADSHITHLLIKEGVVYPSPKLIPVDWVAGFEDNRVLLSVEKAVVDRLPDYEGG